nr:PqqD family protein [Streptomyces sp. NBC_00830]WTB35733.1 PqqD family protein [Streptomyces sp. NBC_00830]
MRVRPIPNVTASLGPDGTLELVVQYSGRRVVVDALSAAMWMALRQQGGDVNLAAEALATHWNRDHDQLRCDLAEFVDRLCDARLVVRVPEGEPRT